MTHGLSQNISEKKKNIADMIESWLNAHALESVTGVTGATEGRHH